MKKIVYLIVLIVLSTSCKEEKNLPTDFDYGVVENGVYKNNYFGVSIPFNPDWDVQSQKQMSDLTKSGTDLLTGDNDEFQKVVDASLVNVAELFMIFKHELGSTTEFNPSFIMNAENLKQFPNVKDAEGYLVSAKDLLLQSNMQINFRSDEYEVEIGNEKFICMEIENASYGIFQDYFVTLKRGFAIAFIVTYVNEEDKKELYSIIENIKINKY